MFLTLRYALYGALLGFAAIFFYSLLWLGADQTTALRMGGGALIVGLFGGIFVGVAVSIFGTLRKIFNYRRYVTYKLAPCAWCRQTGKNFLILPCRVCRGYGSVLVPSPRRRCRWCRGTGTEFKIFRCTVCDGAGWAYGQNDEG